MAKAQYATRKEAQAAGWFSRRNRTNEAHMYAREMWQQKQARKKRV